MKSQQGYFSSDGNYQFCLFISLGKQKIKENILVQCFLSNITEVFFFSIILSLFPFHMFIHILIKYVLCDIHCHNYSNSSQHLYILYYATQQDRCSMPVCTHKKAYGSVHILQLRNIQLSEVLEVIFLRLSYATNI